MSTRVIHVAIDEAVETQGMALQAFGEAWLKSSTYSLTLHVTDESIMLPPYAAVSVLGAAVCLDRGTVYYLPLPTAPDGAEWQLVRAALARPNAVAILPGLKSLAAVLLRGGVRLCGKLRDPTIAAWLLSPNGPETTSLSLMCKEYLDPLQAMRARIERNNKENAADGRKRGRSSGCNDTSLHSAQQRASQAFVLMPVLEMMLLEAQGPAPPAYECEANVSLILAQMELAGMRVHTDEVLRQRDCARAAILALEARAKDELKLRPFKWSSTFEVGRVIFDELRLGENDPTSACERATQHSPSLRLGAEPCSFESRAERRARKKGIRAAACPWDTSSEALALLENDHPLPRMIIQHRQVRPFRRARRPCRPCRPHCPRIDEPLRSCRAFTT